MQLQAVRWRVPLPADFALYLITDRSHCADGDILTSVERALQGGVQAVQLRDKDLSTRERYELACELRSMTRDRRALLFINGDAALARSVHADGVHLPQDGLPVDACRRVLEPDMLIGVSTHSLLEAQNAEARGADFVTYGPVYHTPSKAQYGPPVGIESLRAVCRTVRTPVIGLGGIKPAQTEEVVSAGAAGVAVISAILAAPDIERAASEFVMRLREAKQNKVLHK
jgi:thiamine-phosphate pyrophosphorylase